MTFSWAPRELCFYYFFLGGGGGGGYMRETGAICQVGVFAAERSLFWAQTGPFSVISHYKNSDAIKYSTWATFIENVVRNRRK